MRWLMMLAPLLGAALLVPSTDAMAQNCAELTGQAKKNCQNSKGQKGKSGKAKGGSEKGAAFRPSGVAKGLANLDPDNPLAKPRYFTEKPKRVGVQRVDRVAREVTKIEAAANLGRYTTDLADRGRGAEAVGVAAVLAPAMTGLAASATTISRDIAAMAKNPMNIPGVTVFNVAQVTASLASSGAKLPGALEELASVSVQVGAIAKRGAAQAPDAIKAIPDNAKAAIDRID